MGNPDLFYRVLGAIETGIIILDVGEAEVFYINDYAAKILGKVNFDLSFAGFENLLSDELDTLIQGSATRSPKRAIRNGNRLFGYTLYALARDRQHIAAFIQDITDQKRLEAIDEASEMMNNIGFLFSSMRHEIGNPINSIKMALEVVRKNLNSFSVQEFETYIERIFGDLGKMEVLLKSLKTFNLFEKPRPKLVDLNTFFAEFIQLLALDTRRKNIAIVVDLAVEARMVIVDVRALQHVVLNIFANAMDALLGREEPRIEVRSQLDGSLVSMTISDNGCGIDKVLVEDIFKPFFTTKPDGTGLGLMLSRKMLAQMNCSMEISSVEGNGTTVTFHLPVGAEL